MSFPAKRELLAQVAQRYREASHTQKSIVLDEFLAATGYARKYAIRLLTHPVVSTGPITRPRPRRYGPAVQDALTRVWAAANYICAKRLVPFLPEFVPSLERHGHLTLTDAVREQLLALSPATAGRIFREVRQAGQPRGIPTTRRGNLLKHQVPVRTFSDWSETTPGFFEADLVAHCGTSASGAFLYSFVLTDVATTWTECVALRSRSSASVIQALEQVRRALPFPLLGFDTDNGSEFLNNEVIAYCQREQITFTRGRAYKKNDQCYVEQKNGSIVRQLVGYDRYEGEVAYQQLTEVYRAVRLYVNCFQPSMKLESKRREGSKVQRRYHAAQTPAQRLLASTTFNEEARAHLERVCVALDPVRLLQQVQTLQDALWRHAVRNPTGDGPQGAATASLPVRFAAADCLPSDRAVGLGDEGELRPLTAELAAGDPMRRYHHAKKSLGPRTYRTRPDPFAVVHQDLYQQFLSTPEKTASLLFADLQRRYPGVYPDHLLRTLQRRVQAWRKEVFLAFDDRALQDDVLAGVSLPTPLRARTASPSPTDPVRAGITE